MNTKNQHINIPVSLCFYAFEQRLIRPIQVYMYLAFTFSGKAPLTTSIEKKEVADFLALKSIRSVSNNLKILQKIGFITYSQRSKLTFIKSIDRIRKEKNLPGISAVRFLEKDLKNFRAFAAATVIAYLVRGQIKKRQQTEKTGLSDDTKVHRPSKSKLFAAFYPVSGKALAKILNVSLTTAYMLKKQARDNGYIKMKSNLKPTGLTVESYWNVFRNITPAVKIRNNELYVQGPDLVKSNLRFKSRKYVQV